MEAPTSQLNSRDPSHPELVEPASQSEQGFQHDSDELEEINEWKEEAEQFETDFDQMKMKIHRFPAALKDIDQWYINPMAVSIGIYHHKSGRLHEMEKVKRVAAHHFVKKSGRKFDVIYAAVFSIIGTARQFYDTKVDIKDAEFADMMFIDGCFLLMYMLLNTHPHDLPQSLLSCFKSNEACISNDIMKLENQLPWIVVDTLRRHSSVPVEEFISKMGQALQIRGDMNVNLAALDGIYKPPHLLGILWFFKTGSINSRRPVSNPGRFRSVSKSISAIELGEIGIKLTASKTTKFADMGVKIGFLSSKMFLAPLLLDDIRSCWLANMAAFELSLGMASQARNDTYQIEDVVCSYIAVLAMLMDRVEDVHELRSKGLVQGEPTNKDILYFFKMLNKRITDGPFYNHIMAEVEAYKVKRWIWIKVHRFVYKNFKAIVTVFTIIGVLVGIFKALLSLKKQ